MGKSAGKWIKTVLFGKKHPKSNFSKNVTPDKKTGFETGVDDLAGNSPVISDPCQFTERGTESLDLENGVSDNVDSQSNITLVPVSDAERKRQEQAATQAQAAFRGYLARRAFRALKGIIRLQALIRGHLVRRQAVATLRCMHAIVKFQALARGRKVRLSYGSSEVLKKYDMGQLQGNVGANSFLGSGKLATNAFICKLLVTLPTAMPLSLQYDVAEPNSAWNWLELWSLSRFWEPPSRAKKIVKAKPHRKQGVTQIVESEGGKSKRTFKKGPTAANGDNNALAYSETEKPKRHPRKVTSQHTESMQEQQPQNELERVKRNLRKVSASAAAAAAASEKSEMEPEKAKPEPEPEPIQIVEIVASDLEIANSSENPAGSDVIVDKQPLLETPSKTTITDEAIDVPHDDHPVIETHENGVKIVSSLTLDDESSCKEEQQSGKENQKMIKKRRSLPAKQEYTENVTQNNSPSLPSYMLATESAKAKLRLAQGSSKVVEDESGYVRRHSLPAPTNGKLTSLSPKIQKLVQSNGKGGTKTNKSLTSSRDDKGAQPGWRR